MLAYLGDHGDGVCGSPAGWRAPATRRGAVRRAACVAAIVASLVGSALMDTLALPQIPYLFCFVAALAVVTARAQKRPA